MLNAGETTLKYQSFKISELLIHATTRLNGDFLGK